MTSPSQRVFGEGASPNREHRDGHIVLPPDELPDLAPMIPRQRLVIEGLCDQVITSRDIVAYLRKLTGVCAMKILMDPVTHRSDTYGWAGWVHWETSGAHFYAWEQPLRFFSVDIYTCKPFDITTTVDFTADFFDSDRVVARPF